MRSLCQSVFYALFALLIIGVGVGSAADYYVDVNAQAGPGTGSSEAPWASLAIAFRSGRIRGGDRVFLADGSYGALILEGLVYEQTVTIASAPGARVHVSHIEVAASRNLTISGLMVWPTEVKAVHALAFAAKSTSDIVFSDLYISTRMPPAPDTDTPYFDWTLSDWIGPSRNHGVTLAGDRSSLLRSLVIGTDFAITTTGADALVDSNIVKGFSGDALRGLGDNTVFTDNHVQDCFAINDNHDDGFQSWAPRGTVQTDRRDAVTGLTISNNVILEWTGPADHPLQCSLQGIGLFDGPYRDLNIFNNVVAVSAYHGISVYGGEGVNIIHNTVAHSLDYGRGDSPFVMISDHKDGRPTTDITVANNLAMSFKSQSKVFPADFLQRNAVITEPGKVFLNAKGQNYRLPDSSQFIDAGSPTDLTDIDINGQRRSLGKAPDLGAYEIR